MNEKKLREIWEKEEDLGKIKGWDFSHIAGRYEEEKDLPWNYESLVRDYLKKDSEILDCDTGGGEFLLSLNHPYKKTSATEGYEPNVRLCRKKLLPLGINFKACDNPSRIPFEESSFDLVINRHGAYDPKEIYRLLKKDGLFISQQVGGDNDRDLVQMVLPNLESSFPEHNLKKQKIAFEKAGFKIIKAQETYRSIKFYDIGAFVWFAKVIPWEFTNFSVDKCFDNLLVMQRQLEEKGQILGNIHRFLIIAKK